MIQKKVQKKILKIKKRDKKKLGKYREECKKQMEHNVKRLSDHITGVPER